MLAENSKPWLLSNAVRAVLSICVCSRAAEDQTSWLWENFPSSNVSIYNWNCHLAIDVLYIYL